MRRKQILLMLSLLCAIVQGAWAANGIYCTASDKGRVVCTDGSIYDDVAAATAANKTAVAKIIWVDESAKKGLALALQDEPWYYTYTAGISACNARNTSQPVAGATWKLASKDEWDTMINAAGGFASLRDGFGGIGGSNLITRYSYSSSSSYDDSQYWTINFNAGSWSPTNNDMAGAIRACLSFNLLTLYTISNQSDWTTFCNDVNGGNDHSNYYVKLTSDISIETMMAGTSGAPFCGLFDGDGHTLTVSYNTTEEYTAPFRHVKAATIKNLHVAGTITTSAKFAGGIVGESHGDLTITDCRSSVTINSSVNGDGTHGGFVSTLSGAGNTITIDGCVFDGSFATTNGTVGCGGFIGWPVYNKPVIKNSIMKPSKVDAGMVEKTFTRWYDGYEPSITNCYFVTTDNLPTNQGTPTYASVPDGEICKKLTFPYITIDDVTIYSTASTVSGVETSYNLDNGVARIEPVLQAPGGNTTLRLGTDYTVTLDGNPVSQIPLFIKTKGSYTLILTGQGDYSGTKTFNITITGTKDYIPVSSDATLMTDGVYVVENDVSIGSRINISGNVTLFLSEGTTLTASKGIELSQDNQLTIDGPGALVINNCDNQKAGIGSGSAGTLIINDGVITVTGGPWAAGIGCNTGGSNNGNITINGGKVTATGGKSATYGTAAAAIGGCYGTGDVSGTITINGGQVTANGSYGIGNGQAGTHKGTLTLGWTKPTDFIQSTNYGIKTVFAEGKQFLLDGTETLATTNNIKGKKIVPLIIPALSGEGTEESPYLINNADDWTAFATYVRYGIKNYNGQFVKLTADISATKTVGLRNANPFCGTFLGNGHTITATLIDDGNGGLAPFRYVKNATIKDVKVAGTIASNQYHSAGLVGFADGTNLIENCTVTATLNVNNNYAGGIIGHGLNSATTIKNSVFAGTINGVGEDREHIGGIWGWCDNATPTLENCLEAGTYTNIASMHPMGLQGGKGTITNCYYVNPQIGEPSNACTVSGAAQVYAAQPDNEICKTAAIPNTTVYLSPACTVSGIEDSYSGSANVSITPVVTFGDDALTLGTDYTATLDGQNVVAFPVSLSEIGSYTLILTGTGSYSGSKTLSIVVQPDGDASVTLTDGDTYAITVDAPVASATYKKTLGEDRVGKYHSWLVPFDYTIKAADLEKFTFYKINMIANSPDPDVETTDEMWVFVTRLAAGDVLKANKPYVYKPEEAVTDYEFTTTDATLKAKDTGVLAKAETLEDIYTFYATYEPTTATASDPFYYVANDGTVCYGDAVTVGSLRWILRKASKDGSTPSYAQRMRIFDGEDSGETTGIKTIDNLQFDSEGWYTLDGRRLSAKPAKSGIYVKDGRKVVIK